MKRLSSLFLLATTAALAAAAASTAGAAAAASEPLPQQQPEPAPAPVSKDTAAIIDALTKGGISPETFADSLTPEQQAIYLSKLQPSVASAESGAEGEPSSRRVSGRWQQARLLAPDPASLAALADAPAAGSGYGELALKRALVDEESPYGRFEMSAKYWPGGMPPLRDLPPPSAYADVQYALDRPEVAARGVGPASVDAGGEDVRRQTPIAESDVGGADGYDYADLLEASLLFYEAQRSGKLPPTNRIKFRNDSSLGDKAPDGSDISGGYHDAGDHLKLNFPMAWTFTHLAWGYLDFRKGFDAAGQAAQMRSTLKWAADYFMKCHFDELSYVAQVGTESADHGFWGRPEDMKMARPSIAIGPGKPGSDLAGQTAAALAAIAMAFEAVDPEYAMKCEAHARELYALATRWEGKFSNSLSVGNMYPSNSYLDDLTMAAGWLARRTGEPAYLADAANYWKRMRSEEAGAAYYYDESWQGCHSGASMLLAEITGEKQYSDAAHAHAEAWVQGGRPVYYTPAGLAFVSKWGSLRTMANNAFMVLLYAHSIRNTDPRASGRYSCWARNQLRYALGDTGRSFVVGMGNNPPKFVHHRSASCPDSTGPVGANQPRCDFTQFNSQSPNPQILKGALAGGPDSNDWYNDKRDDYVLNEVAIDYNAGFTGSMAYLTMSEDTWEACKARGDVPRPIKKIY